jgi:hypothetical protein
VEIALEYSHLGGAEILKQRLGRHRDEIIEVIRSVTDPGRTKVSKEKTMPGELLYSPKELNRRYAYQFRLRQWKELRDRYDISIPGYSALVRGAFKQVDFVKPPVAAEVQFGKYAFMFYDLAKFQYFYNKGQIQVGVEIVPTKRLHDQMSTGVSYGEQLISDLERLQRNFPSCPVLVVLVEFEEPSDKKLEV